MLFTNDQQLQNKLMIDFFKALMELSILLFSMCLCECLPVKLFFFFFLTSEATRQKTTDAKPRSNPSVQFNTMVSLNTASIIQWIQRNFHLFVGLSFQFWALFKETQTYSYVNTFAYWYKEMFQNFYYPTKLNKGYVHMQFEKQPSEKNQDIG